MADPKEKPDKSNYLEKYTNNRNSILYIFLVLMLGLVFYQLYLGHRNFQTISYSQFLDDVEAGKVEEVQLGSQEIRGSFKKTSTGQPKEFIAVRVEDPDLPKKLQEKGVSFSGKRENTLWQSILVWTLPLLILIVFWRWMFRKMDLAGRGSFLNLGKSKAKIYMETGLRTTFKDVAGVDEAIQEVKELVEFLKQPEKYTRLGGRNPKGILLVGAPGTGKTLLARAVAGEAKVPFLSINGSEFVEMFVGLGAARVRDLFEQARKNAPCIIFIDELDALGKSRAFGQLRPGSTEESEQTLNQLLAELDGFDPSEGVVFLAATNRPEVLDPALLRAGRFDRQILLDKPDHEGRAAILKIHLRKVKLAENARVEEIAGITPGFSGADLANLVNEAALMATRRGADAVYMEDFTSALERIVAGLERKKRLMNPQEKLRVAYHEMGHATVALALGAEEKVHKVSIIPRGFGALGYTLQRPTEDRYLMSRKELVTKMAVLLGGRASEDLTFQEVSTGASDDFVKASDIARAMSTQYGMSEKLGMVSYEKDISPFLKGAVDFQRTHFSEKTAEMIDQEVKTLVDEAYRAAINSLHENGGFLEAGAKKLLEKETLSEKEIYQLWEKLKGMTLGRFRESQKGLPQSAVR